MTETDEFDLGVKFLSKNKLYSEVTLAYMSLAGIADTLVLAYMLPNDKNKICYDLLRIGKGGKLTVISLANETGIPGDYPQIAAKPSSKTVVLVSLTYSLQTYYSVGKMDGSEINWLKKGIQFGPAQGLAPTVAVSSNVVVTFFEASTYFVGKLTESTGEITWKGQTFPNDEIHSPSACITNDDQVILVHTADKDEGPLCYSIGKVNSKALSVEWLVTKVLYYEVKAVAPKVVVDPSGVILEVHKEKSNSHGDMNQHLFYRLGKLCDSGQAISWRGTTPNRYTMNGMESAIAAIPHAANIFLEFHYVPERNGKPSSFVTNTIMQGAELVNIQYGSRKLLDGVPFAAAQIMFQTYPHSVTQTWNIEESYCCTSTHSWEKTNHMGISVTASASVGFHGFGASVSVTGESSVDLTIGKELSQSKTMTWSQSVEINIPASEPGTNSKNVMYTATLSRLPSKIPFTATFRKGDIEWTEKGTVDVSHASVLATITSKTLS